MGPNPRMELSLLKWSKSQANHNRSPHPGGSARFHFLHGSSQTHKQGCPTPHSQSSGLLLLLGHSLPLSPMIMGPEGSTKVPRLGSFHPVLDHIHPPEGKALGSTGPKCLPPPCIPDACIYGQKHTLQPGRRLSTKTLESLGNAGNSNSV